MRCNIFYRVWICLPVMWRVGMCLSKPIGEKSVVKMNASIYGSTSVGEHCTVGGEIKNALIFGYSNKGHEGYLGDSIIGYWCNIGAGTCNSNIKNTASAVQMWNEYEQN